MEFRKMVTTTLYVRQNKRDTDVKNRLSDSVGEGEGGMIWENSIETCILSYVKHVSSPGSVHETGAQGLVHWDDPEGGGRGVQEGEHVYACGGLCWYVAEPIQYCKVISLQLK